MEDKELLVCIQQKDQKALEFLIDRYGGFVFSVIRAAGMGLLNQQDIEEIASETFVKLWDAAGNIQLQKGSLKSYLGAIARNEARSCMRRLRPVLPMEDDILTVDDLQVQCELERKEQEKLVREALAFLEPITREIFLRYYYGREKIMRIAEDLQMNPSTVKSRLARGRDMLRRALQERGISHEDVV